MRRIFNRFILGLLQSMPLKKKLLISYSVLIIIPLAANAFFFYSKITETMLERAFYSAIQSFHQTHSYLSYKLYKIIQTSDLIATDKQVNDILEKPLHHYPEVDQVEDMMNLVRYLSSMKDDEDVFNVKLYVKDGLIYSNENRNLFNLNDVQQFSWYKKLMSTNDKVLGLPDQYFEKIEHNPVPVISLARKINNNKNYHEIFGLLRLDLEKSKIDRILANANALQESYTYLQNSEGWIVASSHDSPVPVDQALLQQADWPASSRDEDMSKVTLGGRKVFYKAKKIPYTDWMMVTVIPESSIVREINELRQKMLLQIAVLATVAYAFAYYISVSITGRVSRIVSRMKRVQEGELNSIIANTSKDEIGELIDNYNYMLGKIQSLVREQYELGQELKSAELRALQSQINPHFLYNTLDLINWLSQKNKIGDIHSVTLALANFYKFSLNKGRDISTVDFEIRHVLSYVQIQNIRFRNKIHLQVEVDDEVRNCMIPKITLQPLVENAILHGILEKPEKEGTITIKARRENGFVALSVCDDGVGIPQEMLKQLENGSPIGERGNQYALRNIRERLRIVYGKTSRLEFSSKPGEGTTVMIVIPAMTSRDSAMPGESNLSIS